MLETKNGKLLDVTALDWTKARSLLLKIRPEIIPSIDRISLDKEQLFFLANYQFGSSIIDDSEMYLPLVDGSEISFNDIYLPDIITQHLSYNTTQRNPVGIIISKTSEYYLPMGNLIIPYKIIKPGDFFGLSSILDNNDNLPSSALTWNLGAGARSIFMLAKISENKSHNHLKKIYGITSDKPMHPLQQWQIFKEIAKNSQSSWRQSILYFSKKFLERLDDVNYATLYNQLVSIHRLSYNMWHNKNLKWESEFSQIVYDAGLRDYSDYMLNIANHLFLIARGVMVGFAPTIDESQFPTMQIKKAYEQGYGLVEYCLSMVQPEQFIHNSNNAVYYSINFPTQAKYNPMAFKGKTNLDLLDSVMYTVNKLQNHIKNHAKKNSDLYIAATNAVFEFYHYKPGMHKNIKNSTLLAQEDTRFIKNLKGTFPAHSLFTKCCVKINPQSAKTNT